MAKSLCITKYVLMRLPRFRYIGEDTVDDAKASYRHWQIEIVKAATARGYRRLASKLFKEACNAGNEALRHGKVVASLKALEAALCVEFALL